MNTKQIIAVLAIVAIAAAAVAGTAYAYQATLTDEGNFVDSNYLELNGADAFQGHFTNADLQWSTVSTEYSGSKTYADYKPDAYTIGSTSVLYQNVARDIYGVQVANSADAINGMTIQINSASMKAGDWFQFSVTPKASNGGDAVDLGGTFAMQFTYTADSDIYTDCVVLSGANTFPMFISKERIAAGNTSQVVVKLFAIDAFHRDVAVANPDFTLIDFEFKAENITAQGKTLSTADLVISGAGATVSNTKAYASNGALVATPEKGTAVADQVTYTVPSDNAIDAFTATYTAYGVISTKHYSAETAVAPATGLTLAAKYTDFTVALKDEKSNSDLTFSISATATDSKAKILAAALAVLDLKAFQGTSDSGTAATEGSTVGTYSVESTVPADTLTTGAYSITYTLKTSDTGTIAKTIWIFLTE